MWAETHLPVPIGTRSQRCTAASVKPRRLSLPLVAGTNGAEPTKGGRTLGEFLDRWFDAARRSGLDVFWLRDESLEDSDSLPTPGGHRRRDRRRS